MDSITSEGNTYKPVNTHEYTGDGMANVNVTISVNSELKKKMAKRPEMNWSEVARQAWEEKLEKLELLNELTKNSTATDKDIMEISRKIKAGMARWHEKRMR
jgi:hypothetical protein